MKPEESTALRAPFAPEQIGKLPRAGTELDFVGHANVNARLLDVDPEWSWEPCAWTESGTPMILLDGNNAVLWIKMTVCGVTRLGVGIVTASAFELQKQLISDALRNAAMRFGVALDLWSKEPLHAEAALPPAEPMATKSQVTSFNERIDELEDDQRSEFLAWKADQGFPWPWPLNALEAMYDKLEQIVGAGSAANSEATADATTADQQPAPTLPAGDSDEPAEAGTDDHPSAASSDTGASEDLAELALLGEDPM